MYRHEIIMIEKFNWVQLCLWRSLGKDLKSFAKLLCWSCFVYFYQVKPLLQVTDNEAKMLAKEQELKTVADKFERLKFEKEELQKKEQQLLEEKNALSEQLQAESELCAEAEEVNIRFRSSISISGIWNLCSSSSSPFIFSKCPSVPCQARVLMIQVLLHIPEHGPFRLQSMLFHVIFHTLSPSLPAPAHTSHPCCYQISTGRHPFIHTFMLQVSKPPRSATPHHIRWICRSW